MSEEKPIEQMTVDEAKVEIDRRLENFEGDYWVNERPGHKRAVDEMRQLHEVAFPEKGEEPITKEQQEEIERAEQKLKEMEAEEDEEAELSPEEKESLDNLKSEWGEDFDGNIESAQNAWQGALATVGDSELNAGMEDLINKTGIGNNPIALKWFHELAKKIKEGTGE